MTTERKLREFNSLQVRLHATYDKLRIGQMLVNAVSNTTDKDLYYLSDDELLDCLRKYCERSGV